MSNVLIPFPHVYEILWVDRYYNNINRDSINTTIKGNQIIGCICYNIFVENYDMSLKYMNKLHLITITMTKYIVSHDAEDNECIFVSFAVEQLCPGEIYIKMAHGICVTLLVQVVKQNKRNN